jgi:hypothetical protein
LTVSGSLLSCSFTAGKLNFPQHVTIPQALAQREYPYGTIGAKVFFFFCDADEDELGAKRPRKLCKKRKTGFSP